MARDLNQNVNPVPLPKLLWEILAEQGKTEDAEHYKPWNKTRPHYAEYLGQSVVALGIASQSVVDSWKGEYDDVTGKKISGPPTQGLTPLQFAQLEFAYATKQILYKGEDFMSPEGQRGQALIHLDEALKALEESGGKLSDLMPWVKPPPSNAEVMEMIKDKFPPTHQVPDGQHVTDGKSILAAFPNLLKRSGVEVEPPKAEVVTPRGVVQEEDAPKGYQAGVNGSAFTAVVPATGNMDFGLDKGGIIGNIFAMASIDANYALVDAKLPLNPDMGIGMGVPGVKHQALDGSGMGDDVKAVVFGKSNLAAAAM